MIANLISKTSKATIAICASVALSTLCLAGCSTSPTVVATSAPSSSEQEDNVTYMDRDAIAATSGDVSVTEGEVADYIAQYRNYAKLEDDVQFATLLDESGSTPADVRSSAIEQLMRGKLAVARAEENGIEVIDEEINEYISSVKDSLGYSGSAKSWSDTLDVSGYDDESYRRDVKTKLIIEKLVGRDAGDMTATESQMIAYANSNPTDYVGADLVEVQFSAGQRRAAEAFAKAADGKFEEEFRSLAASEVGSGAAEKVIDWGWTCIKAPSSVVALAVAEMTPGQCKVVQDDDGAYKVVYVSAIFVLQANGRVDYANMPDALKAKLRSDASVDNRDRIVTDYLRGLYESTEVVIAAMPADADYNVDMTLSTYGDDDSVSDAEVEAASQDQLAAMEAVENSLSALLGSDR